MFTVKRFIRLVFLLIFCLLNDLSADVVYLWAVGDGEKVFKYSTNHFAKKSNSLWDGKKINLRGIYNEVIGFQIIVELDSMGSNALEISISPPLNKESGKIIGGEGMIKYGPQGRMPFQTSEDRGLNLALPSIRLKNIRRGQQDYELLWLAEQKIGKAEVDKLVRKVVPKAMSEVEKDDPVAWSQRGDVYDKVRNELLDIISK